MPAKKEASLLPDEENLSTPSGRIIRWLTTIGRVVIVITELIVIGAFLSRFWLDRKNSDLSEVLRQQKAIVGSTNEFQQEFSILREKLKTIKAFYADKPLYAQKISSLSQSTPPEIVYDSLSISEDPANKKITASLSTSVLQEEVIISFINNLILNPDVEAVQVNNITKKPKDNKYSLEVLVIFKGQST
jgi:hypothetical protein